MKLKNKYELNDIYIDKNFAYLPTLLNISGYQFGGKKVLEKIWWERYYTIYQVVYSCIYNDLTFMRIRDISIEASGDLMWEKPEQFNLKKLR